MPETKLFHMRLPQYLRDHIDKLRGKRSVTGWIIEAINNKILKEKQGQ